MIKYSWVFLNSDVRAEDLVQSFPLLQSHFLTLPAIYFTLHYRTEVLFAVATAVVATQLIYEHVDQ